MMRLNEKVMFIDETISCEKSYLISKVAKERFARTRDTYALSDRTR